MHKNWHTARQFLQFYSAADTRYQLHSPFAFELANTLLEDRRWYYAFDDIERIRTNMLNSAQVLELEDYGGGAPVHRRVPLRRLARVAASSPQQGRRLFRLAQWRRPARMLELGTSTGIGALYLGSAAPGARFYTLEGSAACTRVARANLDMLGLPRAAQVVHGPFRDTLGPVLQQLGGIDLAFFDGHHRRDATLHYAEQCLPFAHAESVFVFDDIYWSAEMTEAWNRLKHHQAVRLSVDIFDLGLLFFNPDFKTTQHIKLVPALWKPWKVW